jgi:hypothetical protein
MLVSSCFIVFPQKRPLYRKAAMGLDFSLVSTSVGQDRQCGCFFGGQAIEGSVGGITLSATYFP